MSFLPLYIFSAISPSLSPQYSSSSIVFSYSSPSVITNACTISTGGRVSGTSMPTSRFISPSAHSNSRILKNNRRSRYGQALSVYDSDEEDDESFGGEGEEDDDEDEEIDWFFDEEFAEPADLNAHRPKSKLPNATKMRRESQRKPKRSGTLKTKGREELERNKSEKTKNKYSQLSEEFVLDKRWIPLLDYLSTFGLSESHMIQMYERHMPLFQINVCSARERLEYLLGVGVKHKDMRKILLRQPQILEYTVENNLKSHVAFLVDLGISNSKMGQIITAAPSIFSYSIENSLKPTVRYLVEEVGIKKSDLSKVIQLSPQILVQRVDISWSDRYNFLSKELGAPKDSITKMVTKHPQLLHYSIKDGLLPRINFLRSIGMCNDEILTVLTRLTQVFSLSLEGNLKPKYMYLVNELQNEVKSLTKYPTYLSLSLDQRIRPRHRLVIQVTMRQISLSILAESEKSLEGLPTKVAETACVLDLGYDRACNALNFASDGSLTLDSGGLHPTKFLSLHFRGVYPIPNVAMTENDLHSKPRE
ncbi:hypothetical protein Nepgr_007633 [Nepenthes gracilis]|uniref:Transcription termination factor MTERF9, chloroplastic n=1 Tax=Nepenthes gracilis TaxID=150966 RepID=A0AAD3S787_NEPGR|nr:hypothetical protein Nepgr_007633 [Nepenthes gracilis]